MQGKAYVGSGGEFQVGSEVDYRAVLTLDGLCGWKHRGVGAFAGDGGASCYDSYRRF